MSYKLERLLERIYILIYRMCVFNIIALVFAYCLKETREQIIFRFIFTNAVGLLVAYLITLYEDRDK